jgi:hypothetical protein
LYNLSFGFWCLPLIFPWRSWQSGSMFFVFLMTGIWGLMFAATFAKTDFLYQPIALHFG